MSILIPVVDSALFQPRRSSLREYETKSDGAKGILTSRVKELFVVIARVLNFRLDGIASNFSRMNREYFVANVTLAQPTSIETRKNSR